MKTIILIKILIISFALTSYSQIQVNAYAKINNITNLHGIVRLQHVPGIFCTTKTYSVANTLLRPIAGGSVIRPVVQNINRIGCKGTHITLPHKGPIGI